MASLSSLSLDLNIIGKPRQKCIFTHNLLSLYVVYVFFSRHSECACVCVCANENGIETEKRRIIMLYLQYDNNYIVPTN